VSGPTSRDSAERFKWFWRADKSGAEQFYPADVVHWIPVESTEPLSNRTYIGLARKIPNRNDVSIRWIVRRYFTPEELGYRRVPVRSISGHQSSRLIPPSPNDRRYLPVEPGFHQIEVAESDVIADLEGAGISLPPELSWAPPTTETDPGEWECDRQIIDTLRAVGHRLTTTELLSKMENRYVEKRQSKPSESTVKKRLAVMTKDGRLDNDPKAKPRGYGLSEWDSSAGS
jgi:hypothetical protein